MSPAIRGKRDPVARLESRRPRLAELSGDAADLHDGQRGAVGEHDGHLQDGPQLAANRLGNDPLEGLRAVTALQQESLTARHRGKPGLQIVALAGEHQRRQRSQLGEGVAESDLVRPLGLLSRGEVGPAQSVGVAHAVEGN